MDSESVTVCVGSSNRSPGSTLNQIITTTVKLPGKAKSSTKPAPAKVKVVCPSPAQISRMPRSADAAERWIQSICSPPVKVTPSAKPRPATKPKPKFIEVSKVVTIEFPGSNSSNKDAARFYPNPLKAIMSPEQVLAIGQLGQFSSNPNSHFGISSVLGRQTQVHFAPVQSGWSFSDGISQAGPDATRSFSTAGTFQVRAWVTYKVSYRLVGETSWHRVEGLLSVESNTLTVLVGAKYLKADTGSQGALLVGATCSEKSGQFGCGS
jgi:hypothetical protein